jgi:hypothetical protein
VRAVVGEPSHLQSHNTDNGEAESGSVKKSEIISVLKKNLRKRFDRSHKRQVRKKSLPYNPRPYSTNKKIDQSAHIYSRINSSFNDLGDGQASARYCLVHKLSLCKPGIKNDMKN